MRKIADERAAALATGEKTYFTGKPCKRGHVCERRTVSSVCLGCENLFESERHQRNKDNPVRKAQQKAATRSWVIRNPAKVSARNKRYRQKNPATINRINSEWARKNPDKVLRYARKKRKNNPETGRAAERKWRALNPEYAIARAQKRRERVRANGGTVSAREIADILRRQNNLCASCGASGKLHLDHIMPLKLGGRHEARNLDFKCVPCNLSKASKSPEEWANYREEFGLRSPVLPWLKADPQP